jgi:signal transduction histidine kinase
MQQKNAKVNMGDLPVMVVNTVQMRQVFQNIIINALKFSREDTIPEISISAEKVNGAVIGNGAVGPYYKIYIRDNGIGFNMKYREQIFMAFKRLHTQDQFEGTGIGLSICKKIVEKHHGFITAESEEGKGSTFILTLPVKQTLPLNIVQAQGVPL